MTDNLHDGFGINAGVCQVGHGTTSEVMKHKVLDSLLLAGPLNLSIRVIQLLPSFVKDKPLDA